MRSTRMCSWVFALFLASLSAGLLSCGGGEDGCEGCECTNSCPDGGGGDAAGAKVPLRVETWTLSSDGTPRDLPGAEVRLDSETEPSRCATPCDLEVPAGAHRLYLALAGWVQGPYPLEVNLSATGASVNQIPASIVEVAGSTVRHRLDRRLEGRYRRESDGYEDDVVFYTATRLAYNCPETFSAAGPFQPLGSLCIEGETLSLCKTRASECTSTAEGQILEEGRRVEFTTYYTGIPNTFVYLRID